MVYFCQKSPYIVPVFICKTRIYVLQGINQKIETNMKSLLLMAALFALSFATFGQCEEGETSVLFEITTDNWGYEIYWELTPAGEACGGSETVAWGGNYSVGCNGSNAGGGYGNNTTINEGPWCLTNGETYTILSRDSYGDGGAGFTVNIASFPMFEFQATSSSETFFFEVNTPPEVDGELHEIHTPSTVYIGAIAISGEVKNLGSTTIQSMNVNYSIDGETMGSTTLSGLNIAPFTSHEYSHPANWYPSSVGDYELALWVTNINESWFDSVPSNDMASKAISVIQSIPDITPSYYSNGNTFSYDVIVNSSDQVMKPMDIDFQLNGDLWVINLGTENSGGSTVRVGNPGTENQTDLWQQDASAGHFMSLPSGIAMGNEDSFATCPSVYDANHDGGEPFTGPSLWSNDPDVYAQPSGGNGSHLDMLHESPLSLGIAFESGNSYWVYDSFNNDIANYNFSNDHGPGNSDHGDGEILRYQGMGLDEINTNIACHLEFDSERRWLYFVDGGNQRILRLDVTTGSIGGNPNWGPHEGLALYKKVVGFTWEEVVVSGLVEPAGIDVVGSSMVVTDHSNGDVIFYDISSMPAVEVGRLETGEPGIMGVVMGPQGRIWYCNKDLNKVVRVEPSNVVMAVDAIQGEVEPLVVYPNPARDVITVAGNIGEVVIFDINGKIVLRYFGSEINVSELSSGTYFIEKGSKKAAFVKE